MPTPDSAYILYTEAWVTVRIQFFFIVDEKTPACRRQQCKQKLGQTVHVTQIFWFLLNSISGRRAAETRTKKLGKKTEPLTTVHNGITRSAVLLELY